MSLIDLAVIAFGLFAGYWVVSKLFFSTKPQTTTSDLPKHVPTESTWHDVLELAPDADIEAIRAAYRRLISQYHPDKVATLGQDLKDLAVQKSQSINAAYERALKARGTLQ